MSLFRYAFVALMFFALAGVSEVMAAPKPVKAKITQQPVASAVDLGQSVTLRVVFSSPTPATCQWRRNQVPLPEATGSTYVIDTVLPEDGGKYDVLITNTAGVTASKPVVLTVNLAPALLPVDAVIHGDFTIKALGQSESSDGAYLVTGATTLQDPEAPEDSYTFSYKRLPKNKASLVISGSFYDADLGANASVKDTLSLTFTGVSDDGELLANVTGKGVFTLPGGKKVNFTSTGTIAVQVTPLEESAAPVLSSGSVVFNGGGSGSLGGTGSVGGNLIIRNGSQTDTPSGTNTSNSNDAGSNLGTLPIGGTQGTFLPSMQDSGIIITAETVFLQPVETLTGFDLVKIGMGASNTFTGGTVVNSGTLNLNGNGGAQFVSGLIGLDSITFTPGQFVGEWTPINFDPLLVIGSQSFSLPSLPVTEAPTFDDTPVLVLP